MVILEPSPAIDQSDPGLGQEFDVHGIEAIHLSTHIGKQLRGIDPDLRWMNPVAGGLLHLIRHLGSIDQQFLGNATPDHTGAANTISLHDGDAGTMPCRPLGGSQATGTGAEHHEIKRLVHRS